MSKEGGQTDGGVKLQAQPGEANLDTPPPPPSATLCPFPPFCSPYTGVLRLSSLGEGGMRSPIFVKLVEWLGLVEGSSGPGALCRGGRVAHRVLPLERGCWGGGPFSANSSLEDLGCWADWGCGGDGDTGVCGGESCLEEADSEEPRRTRGVSVVVCWNLVRLVEWLGRGRL